MGQTYGYKGVLGTMWGAIDVVEFLIFIALAVMLVRTILVTAGFFRRYSFGKSQRRTKELIADLGGRVRTVRAIASAAPFVGLAGAAYGILALSARGWAGARYPFVLSVPLAISTALVATATGLIVAITAAACCNVVAVRLEKIRSERSSALLGAPRSYGFAQTLPLRKRFSSMPAFALIGAPVAGILIPMVLLMLRPPIPVGLPVHVLKMGVNDRDADAIVVSVIGPKVIGQSVGGSTVYVNSKETPWNELGEKLRDQLKVRSRWIVYVGADENASWRHVVYVIDVARGLRAEVVLLTARPEISGKKNRSGSRGSK